MGRNMRDNKVVYVLLQKVGLNLLKEAELFPPHLFFIPPAKERKPRMIQCTSPGLEIGARGQI